MIVPQVGWKLVFGVSAMYGRTNKSAPWDSSNAETLFAYTVAKNYSVYAFEFGEHARTHTRTHTPPWAQPLIDPETHRYKKNYFVYAFEVIIIFLPQHASSWFLLFFILPGNELMETGK